MMKIIKWKSLIITCLVCLLPILLGVYLWDSLPDTMAIHFNINNEPDNFASKGFVVFGLPALMALLQAFSCIASDFNSFKHCECKKFENVAKWIIPAVTNVLYVITLGYGLGWNIDIRKSAFLIISAVFLAMGNYLPKLDYIKNYNIDREKAKKINRFMGFGMVIIGVLGFVTVFLPPIASVIWLVLMLAYTIASVIYSIVVVRKN